MSESYDPESVEQRWRSYWDEHGTNEPDLDEAGDPFYNLMMFPYPSAEGLHVGNVYAFTGSDIYGRYQRLRGRDVFEPIGFDAFGIHSENYALEQDVHPMELIPRNVENFRRQLRRMGIMYDWSHSVNTTDPDYYRWTQWLFLQLYEAGLAEKKEAPVNWCPSCQTVLANEQVIEGKCERCDSAVGQKELSQWFFRITEYADRLLENLEWIDWSESTKTLQRNWIGRSEGAEILFPVEEGAPGEADRTPVPAEPGEENLAVYTTRPDTLFGATFMVLAPEHPMVERLTSDDRREEVEAYRETTAAKDLKERKKTEDRAKTGVFTGGYVANPGTGERLPVWVADYVLMEYGTGAIMAVPAHDERDFEFAREFGLEIRPVVVEEDGAPAGDLEEAYVSQAEGDVLVNSGRFDGLTAPEGQEAIVDWLEERGLGEREVNYRLHDWCISRQRYWGPPIPVVYCDECGDVPVPEEDLPVRLPEVDDFRPDASGISPLARVEEFYETTCPECGGPARRETDVSDTFLDSSWYFLRYPSTDFDDRPIDPGRTETWLPVDMYIGGEEHAVLHLLYSRFVTMVLDDLDVLDFEEPYERFRKHGLLTKEGAKISKSRGNVIVPDEYLDEFGADVFRGYLMFAGPFQENSDFRDEGIVGIQRFLQRVRETAERAADGEREGVEEGEVERKYHRTVRDVTEDVEELDYNTAIASLMEYERTIRGDDRVPSPAEARPLVVMIAPVAPHLAEELWERLGGEPSIFENARWPEHDPEKARAAEIEIPVQVNGTVRATIQVERGASEDAVKEAALEEENVRRHLEGRSPRKVIHVPDQLVNLVVEQ